MHRVDQNKLKVHENLCFRLQNISQNIVLIQTSIRNWTPATLRADHSAHHDIDLPPDSRN